MRPAVPGPRYTPTQSQPVQANQLQQAASSYFNSQERISIFAQICLRDVRQLRACLIGVLQGFNAKDHDETQADHMKRHFERIKNILTMLTKHAHDMRMFSAGSLDYTANAAISLLTASQQLEHPDFEETDSCPNRQIDWLHDRSSSTRWLNRNRGRTKLILSGLLSCGQLRRSDKQLEMDNELKINPKPPLAIKYLHYDASDRRANLFVLHVRVSEVMHCLISFRSKHAENIIVRGLDESMCVEAPPTGAQQRLDQWATADRLDLVTPSRHQVFRRITELARCAILQFACSARASIECDHLLEWLSSYQTLYTEPCARCQQYLGQGGALPLFRLQQTNDSPFRPQHEFCQATKVQEIF